MSPSCNRCRFQVFGTCARYPSADAIDRSYRTPCVLARSTEGECGPRGVGFESSLWARFVTWLRLRPFTEREREALTRDYDGRELAHRRRAARGESNRYGGGL